MATTPANLYETYRNDKYTSAKATIEAKYPEQMSELIVQVALSQIDSAEEMIRQHFTDLANREAQAQQN